MQYNLFWNIAQTRVAQRSAAHSAFEIENLMTQAIVSISDEY
jgi:hypothetical protein